jgi:cell division protein FtsW (lipid II flippase)
MIKLFNVKQGHVNALSPVHLIAFINLSLFTLLSFSGGVFDPNPFTLGVAMALLSYYTYYLITLFKMGDTYIASIVSMLFTIGLMMQYRLSPETGFRQFIWFLIGTTVFLISSGTYRYIYKKIRSLWLIYGGIILLFVLTLAIGTELNGAKNWIIIGGVSLQPSEFIKILFVFFMAEYVANPDTLRFKIKDFTLDPKWSLMSLVFLLMGLFVVQREFGTALLIFMVYLSFLYVFEREILFPLGNALVAGIGAVVATQFVHHLQVRIDTWIDPWSDIAGKGYQITQSLFAIGTGGFFGTGIGLGHPRYIPNVQTDFIFSAICEETGIFGGIAVILLFLLLVYRGIKISLRLKDRFTKALAFGLTITFGFQTFIIIGGVIKLIPLTGITLPFVSYGGSSLIASYLTLSILQALSGSILREEVSHHEDVLQQ